MDEQMKKINEYNQRMENEKKQEERTKRIFGLMRKAQSSEAKGIGFILPIWIIAIIILKVNGSEFGDILLYILLASLALGLIIEIFKRGLSAIPFLIGSIFGLTFLAVKGLFTFIVNLFKKKE